MHEPTDFTGTALRYAARDLPPSEAAAFESRLAGDQSARNALAEAVRLSAAALGQEPPAADSSFRSMIRERLQPFRRWSPGWLARRAYRGHPLAWAGVGAALVAAATLYALHVSSSDSAPQGTELRIAAKPLPKSLPAAKNEGETPADAARTAAEIWAELSTPNHVEKTHDDEAKLHSRLKQLHTVLSPRHGD